MARTVIGYFSSLDQAEKFADTLLESGANPDYIRIVYDPEAVAAKAARLVAETEAKKSAGFGLLRRNKKEAALVTTRGPVIPPPPTKLAPTLGIEKHEASYDDTLEPSPVSAYYNAFFRAEISEEDANYYEVLVQRGSVMMAVYIATDSILGGDWEEDQGKQYKELMGKAGAFDREIRKNYSNRGLTTYPQNRYFNPQGAMSDLGWVYNSASPLQQERSNVLGQQSTDTVLGSGDRPSFRRIVSGTQLLQLRQEK
jgi:hypothetical protein